eukprot:CAMPEP_0173413752 /NCGR_PEP_ID=MMETSP1356-20130122/82753_1 /TAXON_ID=77927 ORGANISM="Hemiselmis virescens, Strain PCC157" /NCGR_SAMPLE_ID=MMETSP1356 /ASSEMBLY_ACC=CAM_ASM_000847 /LENGTH=75 /DNA_ID=CAMNT_0014375831 /DNA_START=295 /DNA_END=519 /DNA_ORIENTATION=+
MPDVVSRTTVGLGCLGSSECALVARDCTKPAALAGATPATATASPMGAEAQSMPLTPGSAMVVATAVATGLSITA